ncbi:MAG: CorA family divalent cation transporter [bacterium]
MKATIFDGTTVRPFEPADAQALTTSSPYAWVDIVPNGPHDPQVVSLLQGMGFTDILATYTTRTYSGGMFQAFGDNMVGSTYAAADSGDTPVLVHCVWNSGCFVTIHQGADRAMAKALEDFKPRAAQLFASPGPVPVTMMQLILDSIDRELTDLLTQLGILDGQIIVTTNPAQLSELQKLRNPIAALGTTIPGYAENLSESLVDPSSLPGMNAAGVQALQAYAACVNDIVQRIDSAAGDVRSAIQDYQGQVSSVQGNRINQLTLVSIIFLPITFMTGYFGMNFQWLVNSTQTFGTWVVLGLIAPIVAIIVSMWLLRRGGFSLGGRHALRFHVRRHAATARPATSTPTASPTAPAPASDTPATDAPATDAT